MGKLNPNKYFLYKKRFIIGYILLAIGFLGLILLVPKLAPVGLSNAEMNSAITSQNLDVHSVFSGNLIDLPYHLLQKIVFKLFGITSYTIRIPSIIMGGLLGFLVVLLLNRWFKNNTAIIASIITVLSSSFLFLVSNGTPLIMIVFWPTFLLWVGSKVQGVKRPAPIWCFIFAIALFLSSFTPYMLYLVILILIPFGIHIFVLLSKNSQGCLSSSSPPLSSLVSVLWATSYLITQTSFNHSSFPVILKSPATLIISSKPFYHFSLGMASSKAFFSHHKSASPPLLLPSSASFPPSKASSLAAIPSPSFLSSLLSSSQVSTPTMPRFFFYLSPS